MDTGTLSPAEVADRATEWYERHIRPVVEPAHLGRFVMIDAETGEYSVGDDELRLAADMLVAKPGARLFCVRAGYDAAVSFGGGSARRRT